MKKSCYNIAMTTPILTTKLYIPPSPARTVPRPNLMQHLDDGLHGKLTLVSAGAGFGKTTLVSAWVHHLARPVAWLSLDERDSDVGRFVTYVVAALQTLAPSVGEDVLHMLQSPQPPPTEFLLTHLLNALAAMTNPFLLVLDDYHTVDSADVDAVLAFILDHMPPHMHMVIATRQDPALPLARLRARGQLNELRVKQLRFSHDETAQFLNEIMGLQLTADDIAALESRTEGWVAGLQLAALSLRGQSDSAAFIASFTGNHRFVLDYLIEEVLQHQPEAIQQFLLQTAILDRFCAPLCDALLPNANSAAILGTLEQANLFLIPLDSQRQWYRYHHLFGDLLRQRLQQTLSADALNALHQRASQWYEQNGFTLDAFQHATAAHDLSRAATLLENDDTPLYLSSDATAILRWFDGLPADVLHANPNLLMAYALTLTVNGHQIDRVPNMLRALESGLAQAESESQRQDLMGGVAVMRAMLALPRQDLDAMLTESQQALALLDESRVAMRTLAAWVNGMAHQFRGENEAAKHAYTDTLAMIRHTDNIMVAIASHTCMGQLHEADNQLAQAEASFQHVLDVVGNPPWPTTCEAHFGLARIHYQRNDLKQSRDYSQRAYDLAQHIENTDTVILCAVWLARIDRAEGQWQQAQTHLNDARRLAHERQFDHVLPMIDEEQSALHAKTAPPRSAQPLIEPLSDRELEILRLIALGLSNGNIGERLFLALDTVKGHNRRIFAKLQVKRRTEAVARARELGLID